jgi:phage tail-like protein
MGRNMSFDFGLGGMDVCFKRKFRWLFKIPDICADGVETLPPSKSARPNLTFKEAEVNHLTEIIYYPVKVEWKPISLTMYDILKPKHPVFEWIKNVYDPDEGTFNPGGIEGFKKNCTLELYDGCGNVLETWRFENAWPQSVEFGELDMSSNDIVMLDITLRYDRAFIDTP